MNLDLRDRWLYALTLVLMRKHGFQKMQDPFPQEQHHITDFFDQPLPEHWLVRNEGRDYQLLRIQAVDASGPSALSRDLRKLADHIPLFRKRLRARSLCVVNLYIFPHGESFSLPEHTEDIRNVDDKRSRLTIQFIHVSEDGWPYAEPKMEGLNLQEINIDTDKLLTQVVRLAQFHTAFELKEMVKGEEKRQEEAFNKVFHYGKPYLTISFLVINVFIFMFLEWVGSSTDPQTLITYGAKWNPLIIEGEYWRLVTPMFLHIGIWHLMFNSLALYFLGGAVERIFGSFRFLWIYMFAGISGTLASFAFTPNLAAGASGAIFGCFGALLYFGLKRRNLFFRTIGMDIIFILIFNLAIGFIIPMIDNYGHIGGLIGGFLAAAMVNLPGERQWKERIATAFSSGLVVLLLLKIGFNQPLDSPFYHLIQAEMHLNEESVEDALFHIERALEMGLDRPEVYVQLGAIYNYQGQYEKAEETLLMAKEKGADQAELYFHLSYAQLKQNKYDEGRINLQEAIARDPDMMEAYYNLALVYKEQQEYAYAAEVIERAYQRGIRDEKLEELYEQILREQEGSSYVSSMGV
ncbi:Rhomboid family protein [Caldalkalibacillus thermarum TA2.A1]|uniref:Rhomboid family intramembrane serine protease n=1 Tax=Caldalkalibacillus thermarum (strain TA2.A1) TaxID=986075 RepID=F5LAG5_CALTT|nr:rhomboid family intramembrane serine protease [Caldalkalibacillus thermarum]EGL81714.1 Rhomboid family protein [Caldalkalibacillus thermarum TA2.A1]QZT33301.1 rhomboid family intramembrane serine protease [Caldalkalibacillus thermarum TA2.A1]